MNVPDHRSACITPAVFLLLAGLAVFSGCAAKHGSVERADALGERAELGALLLRGWPSGAKQESAEFLAANMPARDLREFDSALFDETVNRAAQVRETQWEPRVPRELFLNYVLPYASLNEKRELWRADFHEKFTPVVRDCATPGEAAVKLNRAVFDTLKVKYHATKRPKPDQSPSESIAAGYASCTGLSILLVDACRSVGIPARVVGTPSWTDRRGNHTWVEVWDGQWKFLGASESKALNRGWFAGRAAKADPREPRNWIYAASFKKTDLDFPLVWDRSVDYVSALDVTPWYTNRKRVEIVAREKAGGAAVAVDVVLRHRGELVAAGTTTVSATAPLEFVLPGDEEFLVEVRAPGSSKVNRHSARTLQAARQRIEIFLARF